MERCYSCMQAVPDDVQVCPHCQAAMTGMPLDPSDLMPGTYMGPEGTFEIGLRARRVGSMVIYHARDALTDKLLWMYELMPTELCFRPQGSSDRVLRHGVPESEFADRVTLLQMQHQLMDRLRDVPQVERAVRFFTENQTAYLVSEQPQGEPLDVYLARRGGRLPEKDALQLMGQMLTILGGMHQARVLHRALHLPSFYIDGKNHLTLTGFQCAVSLPVVARAPGLVNTGFLAPEQQRGQEEGPCTDLYAAACCMRALLGGDLQTASAHVRQALEKALAPAPDQRYLSAAEFLDALQHGNRKTARVKTTPVRTATVQPAKTKPVKQKVKKEKRSGGGGAVISVFLVLLTLLVCGAVGAVTWLDLNRPVDWPAWSTADVLLQCGDVEVIESGVAARSLPEMTLTCADPDMLTVWQSGNQVLVRGDKEGETDLTISCEEHTHTVHVQVNAAPAVYELPAERITVYYGQERTVYIAPAEYISVEGTNKLICSDENGYLHIKASEGAHHEEAQITLWHAGKEYKLPVDLISSPYESYLRGVETYVELFEGEEKKSYIESEGIDAIELSMSGFNDCVSVVQDGGDLVYTGLKPGTATGVVGDATLQQDVQVVVWPVLAQVNATALTINADSTAQVELVPRSGGVFPADRLDYSAAPAILDLSYDNNILHITPTGVGSCVLSISDSKTTYSVQVTVQQVADLSDLQETVTMMEGDAPVYFTIKATELGDMPELEIICLSGGEYASVVQEGAQLKIQALSYGESEYTIGDGVNPARPLHITVKRLPNVLLDAEVLTQSAPNRTASMRQELRSRYAGVICLDAQEQVNLEMKLNTRYGTLESIADPQISSSEKIEWSFDEATGVMTLHSLPKGVTQMSLQGENGQLDYWIEVFDGLKEIPSWPAALEFYGEETYDGLTFTSWYGDVRPEWTCEPELLANVTDEDARAGKLTLQTTGVGTTHVTITLDGWTHEMDVTIHPVLKDVIYITTNVLYSNEPAAVVVQPSYAFNAPADVTIAEDASATFTLTTLEDGSLELSTTGVEGEGMVVLTDGRNTVEVEYFTQVRATPEPTPEPTPTPTPEPTPEPTPTPSPTPTPTPEPTPTPTPTPVPMPETAQAVIAEGALYVLDGNTGRVRRAALDGSSAVLEGTFYSPRGNTIRELRQGDGVVYGLDDDGMLWIEENEVHRYTSADLDYLMMNYYYLTDVRLSDDAILLLLGADSTDEDGLDFSEYTTGKGKAISYGRGNAAFWPAQGDESDDFRPVFTQKDNKVLENMAAVALHGGFGAAVVEKPNNAGREGKLYFWGKPSAALQTALNIKESEVVKEFTNLRGSTLRGNDIETTDYASYDVISLGSETFAAITDKGEVIMAGSNARGQLGQADDAKFNKGAHIVPLDLGGAAPVEVFCMEGYTLLLTDDGQLFGWGEVPGKGRMTPGLVMDDVADFSPSQGEVQVLVTRSGDMVLFGGGMNFTTVTLAAEAE